MEPKKVHENQISVNVGMIYSSSINEQLENIMLQSSIIYQKTYTYGICCCTINISIIQDTQNYNVHLRDLKEIIIPTSTKIKIPNNKDSYVNQIK